MNKNDLSKALCKEKGLDTSLFFEDFELMTAKEKRDIIAVCESCPVVKQCREYGMSQRDGYGVWGGVFFKRGKIVRSYYSSKKPKLT